MKGESEMSRSIRIALDQLERSRPAVLEIQRTMASMPNLTPALRALRATPDISPALRALQATPDISPALRALQATPDLTPALRALQATPDLTPMLQTLRTLPDVKELRRLSESIHIRSAWQETLASFVDLGDIQDVLEESSRSDFGPRSAEDAGSELSRINAMRYRLYLILFSVLSRDVLRQDAAVQADLLLGLIWLVEVAVEFRLGQ